MHIASLPIVGIALAVVAAGIMSLGNMLQSRGVRALDADPAPGAASP